MALDYSQYLRDKFQEDFEEADEQFSQNLPLRSQLRGILEYVQKEEKFKRPSVLVQMKDCFMKLNDALADCIMFVESSPQKALIGSSSRKILPSARPCKDYWLLIKTWLRLQSIRREMESKGSDLGGDDDREETHPFIYAILVFRESIFYGSNINRNLFLDDVKYHGLDEQAKRIQDFLQQGNWAIGIVGMGGSGKTALARKAFLEMENHFQYSIWISLTEATDLEFSTEMKMVFHFGQRRSTNGTFASLLQKLIVKVADYILDRHIKTLIVLDGVWHAIDRIKYFTGTILNQENVTLIVTSRMEGVVKSLAPPGKKIYLHRMDSLKEEDCWSIFEDSIKRKQLTTSDGKRLSLEETEIFARNKNEIMEKCCGLPLAAKSLAEVLSFRLGKKEFWRDTHVPKNITLRVEADSPTLDNLKVKLSNNLKVGFVPSDGMERICCKFTTTMDPCQIAKELGPFHHIELISVEDLRYLYITPKYENYLLNMSQEHFEDYKNLGDNLNLGS